MDEVQTSSPTRTQGSDCSSLQLIVEVLELLAHKYKTKPYLKAAREISTSPKLWSGTSNECPPNPITET